MSSSQDCCEAFELSDECNLPVSGPGRQQTVAKFAVFFVSLLLYLFLERLNENACS